MLLSSVSFLLLFTDLLANSQHQGLFALKPVLLHGHIHIMSNLEKHHQSLPNLYILEALQMGPESSGEGGQGLTNGSQKKTP